MRLSVIIPAYNECKTIARVLRSVCEALTEIEKEILIVDDCSSDGTQAWLRRNVPDTGKSYHGITVGEDGGLVLQRKADDTAPVFTLRVMFHDTNKGKGGAVQTGLAAATGDVIVIQDADLEYDPADWEPMYELVARRKVADVVFGSRFFGRPHRALYFHHFLGNKLICLTFNALYNQTLSDIEVCYKMFTREVRDTLSITCNDFGFEVQFSAQVSLARRWRIYEVGISYYGRTYDEGKKINWKDGFKALWYLLKFRF